MYNTAPDWFHHAREYFTFKWSELSGLVVTSIFAGFIFTFNDWGVGEFDVSSGIRALVSVSVMLFLVLFSITFIIKFFGLRLGYQITYQPHLLGLMIGLVLCVASAGYLPIFLPGGFDWFKPQRLYVGHWRGYNRPWEVAMLAGAVPLIMLLYVVFLSPIYLATESPLILKFVLVLCLTAIYCLIPLPNLALEYGGRVVDFFRYLKGMTFGLDVYMNSRTWYMPLGIFVVLFSILAYIVTRARLSIAWWIYVVCVVLALLVLWLYKAFWEQLASGFR